MSWKTVKHVANYARGIELFPRVGGATTDLLKTCGTSESGVNGAQTAFSALSKVIGPWAAFLADADLANHPKSTLVNFLQAVMSTSSFATECGGLFHHDEQTRKTLTDVSILLNTVALGLTAILHKLQKPENYARLAQEDKELGRIESQRTHRPGRR